MAPLLIWQTTGRGQMPGAVRKAEARPPAPDPVSQVAADLRARVIADLEGQKRRGGSDRHGQLTAAGTGLGKVRGWSSYAFAQGLTNRHWVDIVRERLINAFGCAEMAA